MNGSINRVPADHFWAGPSHDLSHVFPVMRIVTMHWAILTDRLPVAKFTFFQSDSGIFPEFNTFMTKGIFCIMQSIAIHADHGGDDEQFPFAAWLEEDTH